MMLGATPIASLPTAAVFAGASVGGAAVVSLSVVQVAASGRLSASGAAVASLPGTDVAAAGRFVSSGQASLGLSGLDVAAAGVATDPAPAGLVATMITARLAEILAGCVTANGYLSDCGAEVRVGQTRGTASQAPCIYLTPGKEQVEARYGVSLVARQYTITGLAHTNQHQAWEEYELVDRVAIDVRRVLAIPDEPLQALIDSIQFDGATPGYTEDGGTLCGSALTYTVRYHADPIYPDTAL